MELEILLKICLAALLGGIIGFEREVSHKEAGLRTNILIAVGSTLITILSIRFAEGVASADPARLAAQIFTGVGFLGAGAIIQARFAIHGLTTAATIWAVAAIGCAVGIGYTITAFLVTILVVVILTFFKQISRAVEKQIKTHTYIITVQDSVNTIISIREILRDLGIRQNSSRLRLDKSKFTVELVLTASPSKCREFTNQILQVKGVSDIASENL